MAVAYLPRCCRCLMTMSSKTEIAMACTWGGAVWWRLMIDIWYSSALVDWPIDVMECWFDATPKLIVTGMHAEAMQ